eukprot:TRINITY_DN2461_c0_g1_i2.p1 TRINITY_DN2461_c0_g1~~TRINITY_DN2461_c0_g1_i2.p1  ORF type:complete len:331 (+),score=98.52 TRINITY_DN2461_c0_g1_i2:167-1159(+)
MVIDICGAPEKIPWPVEIVVPYERDLDALGVCVLGEFKVGKTFLINHLCNLKLSSIESIHTRGLSFKRGRPPRDQVVWIDTAGHGCPYDIRKETVEERNGVESLLSEMAYKLADVRIVVVSNCKLREQDFIFAIHKQLKDDAVPGKDLLIVVHNYTRIGDPDLLYSSFQNDVVQRFHIQEVSIPYRFNGTAQKRVWVDKSDAYPIYHMFLGQDGTPAGNKYNEQTFNAIFDLCVDRLAYCDRHNFIENVVQLANDGLLATHLDCRRRVRYDSVKQQIVPAAEGAASLLAASHANHGADNGAAPVVAHLTASAPLPSTPGPPPRPEYSFTY